MQHRNNRNRLAVYEVRSQILCQKWKYLIPALIALQNSIFYYNYTEKSTKAETYFETFLKGMPEMQQGRISSFLIPGEWMLFFVILLCINAKHAKNLGMGLQIMIRSENIKHVWYAKCLGCFLNVCCYYLAAYTSILIFYVSIVYDNTEQVSVMQYFDKKQLLIQIFFPVCTAYMICVWQQLVTILFNTVTGILGACILLIVSAYSQRWYLPGNYLMKLRMENLLQMGIPAYRMFCFVAVILLVGIFLGGWLMKKVDFISRKGDW